MTTTLDTYQAVKFEQLAVANSSNVLFYSRDKYSTVLARKLKPEFSRFFVSSEVKDCLKLLGKITNDKLDASNCIDIIIAEADKSTVNLIDYVNKRSSVDETSNCPLIPIILLLNDNVAADYMNDVYSAGNVNKVIKVPAKTKDILFGIIEILHTRNKIEDTFKDLKKQKIITSKYPYLPLFDNKLKGKSDPTLDNGAASTMNHSTNTPMLSRHMNHMEEVDDGTECSSLLPNFVTTTRLQSPMEYDHRQSKLHTQFNTRLLASKYDQLDELITRESYDLESSAAQDRKMQEMADKRRKQTSGLSEDDNTAGQQINATTTAPVGKSLDDLFDELKGQQSKDKQGQKPRKLEEIRHFGTNEAMADPRFTEPDNDDKTHLPSGLSAHNLRTALPAMSGENSRRNLAAQKYEGNEKALLLLDPSNRPTWNGSAAAGMTTAHLDNDDLSVDDHGALNTVANNDLYPFINKATPKINVRYTVGGLEKRLADTHWKVLNRINMNRNPDSNASSNKRSSLEVSPSHQRRDSSSSSQGAGGSNNASWHKNRGHAPLSRKRESYIATEVANQSATFDCRPDSSFDSMPSSALNSRPSTTKSTMNGLGSNCADSSELPSPTLSRLRSGSINFRTAANTIVKTLGLHVDTKTGTDYDMLPVVLPTMNLNTLLTRPLTTPSNGKGVSASVRKAQNRKAVSASIQAIENSTREMFTAAKNAEKNIMKLSQDKPFDIQVSTLLQLDLYNRKINLGERDLLEKGLKSERDGDFKNASICFSRAGSHSKDQHISKILLGNLHYYKGQLMVALKFFTIAIQLLENKLDHSRIIEDEFTAYHNRGIVNFRLGADESGLSDMETAMRLKPSHEVTREVLSLAKRRMGKFSAAIADAISNKTLRNEKKRNELIEEIAKQSDRRVSVFMSGVKVDPRVALMDRMCSEDNNLPILQSEHIMQRKDSTGSRMDSVRSGNPTATGTSNMPFSTPSNKVSFQDPKQQTENSASPPQQSPDSRTPMNNKNGSSGRASLYASQTSEHVASNVTARVMATRGYCLEIPDYSCQNGLKDKIREHKKLMRGDMVDTSNNDGSFLKVFKLNHGYKLELYDDLFIKPSELQEALLLEPNRRTVQDIETIATTLRLFPFLRPLSDSSISDLANVVEYRALTIQEELFSQNLPSSAMCLLLKGGVQVKMLNQMNAISEDIALGNLPQHSAFGYIDFLFRHTNKAIVKELEEILYPKATNRHNASTADGTFQSQESVELTGHNMSGQAVGGDDSNANLAVGESLLARKILNGEELDRSLSSGMFMTYGMHSMCELLMVGEKDFERILLTAALDDLKRRLEVLQSSCVFSTWNRNDHIRLARMGQVRTFKRGEVILQQGVKPEYLYIIMKGMCKVTKKPNRTEMLVQKLQIARDKAERHDLKYTYHHKLRNVLTKATTGVVTDSHQTTGPTPVGGSTLVARPSTTPHNHRSTNHAASLSSLAISKPTAVGSRSSSRHNTPKQLKKLGSVSTASHLELQRLINGVSSDGLDGSDSTVFNQEEFDHRTEAEAIRDQLQAEIGRLETLIQRATVQDAKDNGTYSSDAFSHSSAGNSRGASPSGYHLGYKANKDKVSLAVAGSTTNTPHSASFSRSYTHNINASSSAVSATNDSILKTKMAEIAVLQWPMLFGEACILDPENGCSRGTIIADTLCDVFILHKTQIQTFAVDDTFLEKVKAKATLYPGDPDIVVTLFRKQEWKQYKAEVMATIPKDRWPTRITEEPFNI